MLENHTRAVVSRSSSASTLTCSRLAASPSSDFRIIQPGNALSAMRWLLTLLDTPRLRLCLGRRSFSLLGSAEEYTASRPRCPARPCSDSTNGFLLPDLFSPLVAGDLSLANRVVMADRKSTRLNSSHVKISYAVFC